MTSLRLIVIGILFTDPGGIPFLRKHTVIHQQIDLWEMGVPINAGPVTAYASILAPPGGEVDLDLKISLEGLMLRDIRMPLAKHLDIGAVPVAVHIGKGQFKFDGTIQLIETQDATTLGGDGGPQGHGAQTPDRALSVK